MNKMKEVAKLFNLELEEEFKIKGYEPTVYKFTEEGLCFISFLGEWAVSQYMLIDLLNGKNEIVKKWKPEKGEVFYIPAPHYPELHTRCVWGNSVWDEHRYNKILVFRTKEEANEASKKMLKALEE